MSNQPSSPQKIPGGGPDSPSDRSEKTGSKNFTGPDICSCTLCHYRRKHPQLDIARLH